MTANVYTRHIHLLYVPTLICNLECRYCYLGEQTSTGNLAEDAARAVDTLQRSLDAFLEAGVLPFNVSLHGGEPTLLPEEVLDRLFTIIRRYYLDHYDELNARGFRKSAPHIKTNLYNFDRLYGLFDRHRVSISASIDLPLSLHAEYRTTRGGQQWLERTLDNLRLLASYPHAKKISSTLYGIHLERIPEIIADIRMINDQIGFDMNNFNIMFGFESGLNRSRFGEGLCAATEKQQLMLYDALKEAFGGGPLEEGLRRNWFDEFTPSYCTNAINCGERFLLLQSDGSVWSCVRGQGLEECYYGNILTDPVDRILEEGATCIARLHQQARFDDVCRECGHLHVCHTGCPIVKRQMQSGRSYTCALQKRLYRDNPRTWPPAESEERRQSMLREYLLGMHPGLAVAEPPPAHPDAVVLPNDLHDGKNALTALIAADPLLGQLYCDDGYLLELNGETLPLRSQILNPRRVLHSIGPDDRLELMMCRSLFAAACDEPLRNTLYLQMLRNTTVIYGDEKRAKQEHLFTHQVFFRHLDMFEKDGEAWCRYNLAPLLQLHQRMFLTGVLNNLFVTTGYLREYHYQKQKANAFYHIQAINLPFQNLEFYWDN